MEKNLAQIPVWVKSVCLVGALGALLYKFIVADFSLDFNAVLSTLLAFFSIFLAAQFYFKATDTSNLFYNNIYTFTKDIAELLARIEAGFGEQLKSIDSRQRQMDEKMYNSKYFEGSEEKLQKYKESLENVIREKDEIIKKLMSDTQLIQEEKEKIRNEFEKNSIEYSSLLEKINEIKLSIMNNTNDNLDKDAIDSAILKNRVFSYTISFLNNNIENFSKDESIQNIFNELVLNSTNEYIVDLEKIGFYRDGELTDRGINFIKKQIAKIRTKNNVAVLKNI